MEMSEYEFENIEADLMETKQSAISMNLKRLKQENKDADLQKDLSEKLAGIESDNAKKAYVRAEQEK